MNNANEMPPTLSSASTQLSQLPPVNAFSATVPSVPSSLSSSGVEPAGPSSSVSTAFTSTEEGKNSFAFKRKKIVKTDIGLPTNFKHVQHLGYGGGMHSINPLNSSIVGPEEEKMLELLREMGVSVPKGQEAFALNYLKERGGAEKLRQEAIGIQSQSIAKNPPAPPLSPRITSMDASPAPSSSRSPPTFSSLTAAENQTMCPICLDNSIGVVFQCGHLFCQNCSDKVMKCPICRSEIVTRINVFL